MGHERWASVQTVVPLSPAAFAEACRVVAPLSCENEAWLSATD
jgi:hypothetical protein